MNKQHHLKFIKDQGSFRFECNRIVFEDVEIEIIEKYGHWFNALQKGALSPLNDNQKRFVEVANFRIEPNSQHEKAWWKYLKRMVIDVNAKDTLYKQYKLENDTFYSRDMVKQLHEQMYSVMKENHRM